MTTGTHTTPPPSHTPRDNVSTGAAAPHCQSRDTGHTRDPGHGDLHGDVGDDDDDGYCYNNMCMTLLLIAVGSSNVAHQAEGLIVNNTQITQDITQRNKLDKIFSKPNIEPIDKTG